MKINKDHVKKGAEIGAHTLGGIMHAVLKTIGTILLIIILTGLIFAVIFASYVKNSLSEDLGVNLSDLSLSQTSIIYYWDEETQSYQEYEELVGRKKRIWVNYEDIPIAMERAAVAIEDKRFYKHHGVDWFRTVSAAGNMFLSMKDTFGGSTITQQLIKNATEYDDVTVKRKIFEIFSAIDLEKRYSKEEIMEYYLNLIFLGENCYGIGAAADVYFGKEASELTTAECASIIAITNNPSLYDPYINPEGNRNRQLLILDQMRRQGYLTQTEYNTAVNQEMVFVRGSNNEEEDSDAPKKYTSWFVDALIEDVIADLMDELNVSYRIANNLLYSGGYKIYATIDPKVQAAVDQVYSSRDNLPSGYVKSNYQQLQSAIVVTDPYTGNIVALAGGIGEKDGSRLFNRASDMQRSPGSTIKPIASYSLAMDLGLIMPYSQFYDSASVKLKGSDWFPNNDDYTNSGLISIRYALQRSINTVAAQLIDEVTPEVSFDFLTNKLGLSLIEDDGQGSSDKNYASLSLGELSYGVSVREMASAYTCFVNNGIRTESRTYTHIEDSSGNLIHENEAESFVALSPTTAYYMTDLMQNVVNAGSGYTAKLSNMPTAGKTGASSKWRDRWFVGFTPYYVAAVWSGYDTPEYMGSSNPSAVLWKQVMQIVHEDKENIAFPVPENMRQVTVCVDTGLLATDACRNEIRGNRTMTLYMEASKIPTQSCQCHTPVEICSTSLQLACDKCPKDDVKTMSAIDLTKATGTIKTPPYYEDKALYKVEDPETIADKQIPYILDRIEVCRTHLEGVDDAWTYDSETGFVINLATGMMYDPLNDKMYDRVSGWEIDWKTGALIDPVTGTLTDPETGLPYTGSTDPNAPDVVSRPPNYPQITPPPQSPDVTEPPVESGDPQPNPGTSPDPNVSPTPEGGDLPYYTPSPSPDDEIDNSAYQ